MLQNNRAEADAYRQKEERPTSVSVIRFAENSVIAAWTSIHGKTTCFSSMANIFSRV